MNDEEHSEITTMTKEPPDWENVDDDIVKEIVRQAEIHITQHAAEIGGKPWVYALVSHDIVGPSATLAGLVARHSLTATVR